MKLKEYAEKINKLVEGYGNMDVAYASDDEGNKYQYVNYSPDVGKVEIDGKNVNVIIVN